MTEDLVFYTHPMSRGRTVRWMLEEIGAPYRTEILDYGPAMKTAGYRALNPMGKVPSIRRGDVVVTETAAICPGLADQYPEPQLAPPPDSAERAPYYRWLFFAAGPLEAALTTKACAFEVPPERQGMAGWGSLGLVTDTLESAVQDRAYLAGARFTAADL